MEVTAAAAKTAKQVVGAGTEEMRLDTVTAKTARMARRAESKTSPTPCLDRVSLTTSTLSSGGYGSNGADGAAGAHVFLTIHDEDTDLLVPLEYDVRGGAGGKSGEHGEPGDGGVGGRGGASHAWYVAFDLVFDIDEGVMD
jgi:hypothetical protein